jgi:hypothetical protein
MDPEQLEIVIVYAVFVSMASVILLLAKPEWTRIKIAIIAGSLLPLLGLGLTAFTFWRWANAPPLPGDTDHHAMAVIGIVILLFLSLVCLVVGIVVSLVVTTFMRILRKPKA